VPALLKIQGGLLDYCLTSDVGDGCGTPAAEAWCKSLGYDRALGITGPVPAPAGNKTVTIQSREECVVGSGGKNCSTFLTINCIREKLFVDPSVDGKLLDWCLEGNTGCGRPAASAFCVSQGFSHGAWAFGGPYQPSVDAIVLQPKTGRTCDSQREKCQAFSSIFC